MTGRVAFQGMISHDPGRAASGASRATPEPAPTNAFSPTVVPGHITLPPPIRAARNIRGASLIRLSLLVKTRGPQKISLDNDAPAEQLTLANRMSTVRQIDCTFLIGLIARLLKRDSAACRLKER